MCYICAPRFISPNRNFIHASFRAFSTSSVLDATQGCCPHRTSPWTGCVTQMLFWSECGPSTHEIPYLTTWTFAVKAELNLACSHLQTQAVLDSKQSRCLCLPYVLNSNSIYQISASHKDLHELTWNITGSGINWATSFSLDHLNYSILYLSQGKCPPLLQENEAREVSIVWGAVGNLWAFLPDMQKAFKYT